MPPPTAPGDLIAGTAPGYLTVAQALAQPSMVDVTGTAVSWTASAGGLYKKALAGNTTLTFTNVAVGDSIRFFLSRTAASGHTITWPSGITWTGGTAAPTDAPGYTEIVLTCTGSGTYAGSHSTRANSAATSGLAAPAAPVAEMIDGGTPASPDAPGEIAGGGAPQSPQWNLTGMRVSGSTDPTGLNADFTENGTANGRARYTIFAAWAIEWTGSLWSIHDATSRWESASPHGALPSDVAVWTAVNGSTGTLSVTGISGGPGSLV